MSVAQSLGHILILPVYSVLHLKVLFHTMVLKIEGITFINIVQRAIQPKTGPDTDYWQSAKSAGLPLIREWEIRIGGENVTLLLRDIIQSLLCSLYVAVWGGSLAFEGSRTLF